MFSWSDTSLLFVLLLIPPPPHPPREQHSVYYSVDFNVCNLLILWLHMLLLRCHWFIHVFFWSDNSWLFVLLLPPPPSLQVTTAWCSHFSRTVSPSCPYGYLHPSVRYPNWGGGGQLISWFGSFCYLFPMRRVHSLAFILSSIAIAGNIAGI